MGDIMETLDKAEKMLCKGIDEIGQKGELNASSLELLGNATDALKDIYSIKEKMDGGTATDILTRKKKSFCVIRCKMRRMNRNGKCTVES